MMDRRFVLSSIGISILLQMAEDKEQQDFLNRITNEQNIDDPIQLDIIESLASKAKHILQAGNVKSHRSLSAELNGLYGFYGDNLSRGNNDTHWLITTDTTLGRYTAKVVKEFLESQGIKQIQIGSIGKRRRCQEQRE